MRKFYKENKEYLSIITMLGINAYIYFLIKLFIPSYNLITTSIDNHIPLTLIFITIINLRCSYLFISYYIVYKNNKLKYKNLIETIIVNLCVIIYSIIVMLYEIGNKVIINKISTFKFNLPVTYHILLYLIILYPLFDKDTSKYFKLKVSIISILIYLSMLFIKQHIIINVSLALIVALILNINTERRKIND